MLTRQVLPIIDRTKYASAEGLEKGAYVLADAKGKTPELILIATGSEVAPTLEAYEKLSAEGIAARLVSMPSWDLFEKQPQSYRDEVLPPERDGAPRRGGRGVLRLGTVCGAPGRRARN